MIRRGLHAYVRLPTDVEAANGADRVRQRTGFPCICGAIDGTHILSCNMTHFGHHICAGETSPRLHEQKRMSELRPAGRCRRPWEVC